jgi:CPA1 family monovalent cation:H+ antiporter
MRGVVSLAAALAIPLTIGNGVPFPHRNLILFITFVVILMTLVVQGLTLPYFIKRSKLFDAFNEDTEETGRQKIRHDLKLHTYNYLKDKYEHDPTSHAGMEKFLRLWEERAMSTGDGMSETKKAMYLELLEIQRQFLMTLNRDPAINEELVRSQLYQIDLEEERLRMS